MDNKYINFESLVHFKYTSEYKCISKTGSKYI